MRIEAKRRSGHTWSWGMILGDRVVRHALVYVHRVMGSRGPFEIIDTSEEISVALSECVVCGLIGAEWEVYDPYEERTRRAHAAGFLLEALAVMGSPPPCDPFGLSRTPHANSEAA